MKYPLTFCLSVCLKFLSVSHPDEMDERKQNVKSQRPIAAPLAAQSNQLERQEKRRRRRPIVGGRREVAGREAGWQGMWAGLAAFHRRVVVSPSVGCAPPVRPAAPFASAHPPTSIHPSGLTVAIKSADSARKLTLAICRIFNLCCRNGQ